MIAIFFALERVLTSKTDVIFIQLLFALTVFSFAIQEKGILSTILHHRSLQYLGLISYSVYLIHALVVEITGHLFEYVLKFPTTYQNAHKILVIPYGDIVNIGMTIIVIVLAHFGYKYIENPARTLLNSKLTARALNVKSYEK